MPAKQNRRAALKICLQEPQPLGASSMIPAIASETSENSSTLKFKGNINHSVCQWCYNFIPLEELCQAVKKIGFSAIDSLAPKTGLRCRNMAFIQFHVLYRRQKLV